jgi:hypothetical protein
MTPHLRIARPVTHLAQSMRMYRDGLQLDVLGEFAEHEGFDGVMLGKRGAAYHLEFTVCRLHPVRPQPTHDDLLVFYIPDALEWQVYCERMLAAGFKRVVSFNPYWDQRGQTFEDSDGYRVVIEAAGWDPE